MKTRRRVIFTFLSAYMATDPCHRLCALDGPTVCTNGSFPRSHGCHAYFRRPSGEHCYHNAATSSTCPDSLPALTMIEAEAIIANLVSHATSRARRVALETTSTTTSEPPSAERLDFDTNPEVPSVRVLSDSPAVTPSPPPTRRRVFRIPASESTPASESINHPTPSGDNESAGTPAEPPSRRHVFRIDQLPGESSSRVTGTPVVTQQVFATTPVSWSHQRPTPPIVDAAAPRLSLQSAADAIASSFRSDLYELSVSIAALLSRMEDVPADFGMAEAQEFWSRSNGEAIYAAAVARANCQDRRELNECDALMTLISDMPLPADQDEALAFMVSIGLIDFVERNAQSLANRLEGRIGDLDSTRVPDRLRSQIDIRGFGFLNAFAANWGQRFPQILTGRPEVVRLVLRHKIYRLMCSEFDSFDYYGRLSVVISRERAWDDSAQTLMRSQPSLLRRGLERASYRGEQAGGAGLLRDWFSLIAGAVSFRPTDDDHVAPMFSPREGTPFDEIFRNNTRDNYNALGRVFALSIIHGLPLGIVLPDYFYKKLLGLTLVLDDMKGFLPDEEYGPLEYAMDQARTEDEMESVFGQPLTGSGANEDVSLANRNVQLAAALDNFCTNGSPEKFRAMADGLFSVIPRQLFSHVSPQDLASFIRGAHEIDISGMRQYSQTEKLGYQRNSTQIEWLFTVLEEYDQPMRSKFLRFVTGRSVLPTGGFSALRPAIQIVPRDRLSDRGFVSLAITHTCYHQIDLPQYQSLEELRRFLTIAVESDAGGEMLG
jgi:hypothetical protein